MTKQNANMAAIAAVVLAVLAFIFVSLSAGHATRILVGEVAGAVLAIAGIAVYLYGRSLKS